MDFTYWWLVYLGIGAVVLIIHERYDRRGLEPPAWFSFVSLMWLLLVGVLLLSLSSRRRW